jgi:hypothetical protein
LSLLPQSQPGLPPQHSQVWEITFDVLTQPSGQASQRPALPRRVGCPPSSSAPARTNGGYVRMSRLTLGHSVLAAKLQTKCRWFFKASLEEQRPGAQLVFGQLDVAHP